MLDKIFWGTVLLLFEGVAVSLAVLTYVVVNPILGASIGVGLTVLVVTTALDKSFW